MRLAHAIETLCAGFAPTCVLEIGRGQPGASSSSLAIGLGHGLLLGMIAAYRWPVVKVQPATWHRALFGKGAAGLPKERALAYVRDPLADARCDPRWALSEAAPGYHRRRVSRPLRTPRNRCPRERRRRCDDRRDRSTMSYVYQEQTAAYLHRRRSQNAAQGSGQRPRTLRHRGRVHRLARMEGRERRWMAHDCVS